jgi:hypothetical protein
MNSVMIVSVSTTTGHTAYHAVAGDKCSQGKTAGEALDALTLQLPEDKSNTLVIVQNRRPDPFFNADQQQRLSELMAQWRSARDNATPLPDTKQEELEALIEAELQASAARAAALLQELAP